MNNIIEDLKLVYDPENKRYVRAYAKIDGNKFIIEDYQEINRLVAELKMQKGVNYLKEIPNDYSLAFVNNEKAIAMFDEKYSDVLARENEIEEELLLPAVINDNSPYDGLVATGIDRSKLKKIALGAAGIVVLTGVALAGCKLYNSRAKEEPEAIVLEKVEAKEITKENPKTWEEYVSDYSESMQKGLLTDEMNEITSNIVTIKVDKNEYKVALSPEEITALNYYYNTFEMTNEDMLKSYGLYNLNATKDSDLSNIVHNGLNKVRLSLVKAETIENVISLKLADEESQKLFDKYANLIVKYNTSKNQKEVKKEVEAELKKDFIENGSIDINEHPSSSIVLQLIPSVFNLKNSPLNSKINTILVGSETNIDVADVKDSVEQNGLVDDSCSVIDRRLEIFDEYRQTIQNDHRIDARLNKELLARVNMDLTDAMDQAYYDESYVESEFSILTKDTYDLKTVMIPIMNEYLSKNYELSDSISFEEINDKLIKDMINELQQQQLNNNKPWNLKTNPSGGKVGDVLKGETIENVPVNENQLTQEQINNAKKEYLEKNPTVIDGTNKEAVTKKEEEIKKDYTQLCVTAWETGQAETINGGPNAATNSTYANHEADVVRNAYFDGRNHGIKIYNEVNASKNQENTNHNTNEAPVDPGLGEYSGDHSNNPNQNNNNNNKEVTDTPVVEEVITPQPQEPVVQDPVVQEPTAPTIEPNLGEYGGSHDQNPNQNGNVVVDAPVVEEVIIPSESSNTTYNIDTTDVIDGTITTDDTGVEDMSQFGEVQASAFTTRDLENLVALYVEELANPNNSINMDNQSNLYKA